MALRLRIPRQSEALDPKLEIRRPYVEEWVEALPYVNTLQVVRSLFDTLRAHNRAPLRPGHRLDLLEAFLPALAMVESAQRHVARGDAAGFERNRASTDGVRQVYAQLAYGYKLVLVRNAQERSFFGGKRLVRLAAQRAMQAMALNLANAWHEYLPEVPHVWSEMGEVFAYAADTGVERDEAVPVPGTTFFDTGVADTLVRISLLQLVDPLKLGPGELWQAYDWLGEVSSTTHFEDARKAPADGDGVLFDPASDRPPGRPGVSDDTIAGRAWYLDPEPAAVALRALADGRSDLAEQALARRCADLMVHRRERSGQRVASDGLVEVARGLPALMHFSGSAPLEIPVPHAPPPIPTQAPAVDDDIIDIGDVVEESEAPRTSGARYETHPWQVVNRSAGGFSLKRPPGLKSTLLVGDLLGIRTSSQGAFGVGLVRWLSITEPGDYRIGVEMLAPDLRIVRINEEDEQAATNAVLLPGRSGPGSVCVAAPLGRLEPGEVVTANGNRVRLRLRIRDQLETAGNLSLVACEAV